MADKLSADRGQRADNLLLTAYCLLILGLVVLLSGCGPSHVVVDNEQGRLDQAAPLPQGQHTVGQTFVSHLPRLTAIETLLVVYEPQPNQPQSLIFHLRESPQSTVDLAMVRLDSEQLHHNDPQRFTFAPIQDSAGRKFYFFLEGSEGNKVTVWSNSVDAYGEGTMWADGQEQPGDLQFKTFYDEDVMLILSDLGHAAARDGWLVLPVLVLFLMPGYLALAVLRPALPRFFSFHGGDERGDLAEDLTLAAGLSLALIPVALLATTLVGWHWDGPRVRGAVVVLALVGVWVAWRRCASVTGTQGDVLAASPRLHVLASQVPGPRVSLFLVTLGAILAVSLALRYLQVRELVLPAWIDSVHHAAMAKLITDAGAIPPTYAPLGPDTPFLYHFGFHTLVAGFVWLTGLEIPRAELIVGQVINGWTVLAMFLLAVRLTGRTAAGLVAALVAGTVSWMPSYYVTWGRYTQLAGLAILPAAIALTMDALDAPVPHLPSPSPIGTGETWRAVLLAGLATAGLLLTHYRVMLMFVAWFVAHLVLESVTRWRTGRGLRQLWMRAAAVGLAGGLITAPWLARLALGLVPTGTLGTWLQGADSFNAVPYALIDLPRNQPLLVLAGLGWALTALTRQRLAVLVPLWAAVLLLITNPDAVGLSSTWLINNASLVISLFVPISLLVGAGAAIAAGWLADHGGLPVHQATAPNQQRINESQGRAVAALIRSSFTGLACLGLVGLALGTGWDLIHIVNPVTVLATRDDVVAMDWVRDHLPADARFLINTRNWQANTYVGADGGYWLPLLTGRETVVPSVLYVFGPRQQVEQITADAQAVENAASLEDPDLQRVIATHRLTHVYLGAKGGKLTPQMLLKDPGARPIYSNGAVWIFELLR